MNRSIAPVSTGSAWARSAALALLLPLAGAGPLAAEPAAPAQSALMRVRIHLFDFNRELKQFERGGWDIYAESRFDKSLDLIVNPAELGRLALLGYPTEVVEIGRPLPEALALRGLGPPSGYSDLAGILARMQTLANTYPMICRYVNLSATLGAALTWDWRSIFALKISDNVAADEDEPTALFVGGVHAREIVTPEAALDAAQYLLGNYGGGTTAFVDRNEIWIVPLANPDGYHKVWTENFFWRKNNRDSCFNMFNNDGIDLNRNFAHHWAQCGQQSGDGCSDVYRGPSAWSEPETQTLMALNQREHFAVSIDYHSYGEDVLWGYSTDPPCVQMHSSQLPPVVATRNALQGALGFTERSPSASGEHFEWQVNAIGVHAYLLEINSAAQEHQPPYSEVAGIVAGLRPGVDVILNRIEGPQVRGHVVDGRSGDPISANLAIAGIVLSDNEKRFSEPLFGRYQWMLSAGSYMLTASKTGYDPVTIPVAVGAGPANQDLALNPQVAPFRLAVAAAAGGSSRIRRFSKP
ncbi:MAG TPA: M14 family zinc carboxypeptidase [Acidobacteriota bacterium]